MKFGFSEKEYEYFQRELVIPLKSLNASIWVFGSRARGDHHKFSDVDVLVSPQNPETKKLAGRIAEAFEEGNFPYKLDLVFEEDLARSYEPYVHNDRVEVST